MLRPKALVAIKADFLPKASIIFELTVEIALLRRGKTSKHLGFRVLRKNY